MFVLSTLAIALQIWTICALWLFSPSQGVTFSLFNFYFSSTWALWVAITVNGTYYEKVYFTCKLGMAENGLPSARALYTVQRWGLIGAALFCIWNFYRCFWANYLCLTCGSLGGCMICPHNISWTWFWKKCRLIHGGEGVSGDKSIPRQ